jgi:predicted alpha/beta-hydrolase family hydrolase
MPGIMARVTTREERLRFDVGATTVSGAYARPANAFALIVVAHGAGSGMDHPFLVGFTEAMNDEGVASLRFNFPYMELGRRSPDRAPIAIAAWRAAMEAADERSGAVPVWASGKSFGGRMASMAVAEGMSAAGLVFLGYPLHPPGKPERIRDEHLYGIEVPMLFLQGTRDPFATLDLLNGVVDRIGRSRATTEWFHDADHSFNVRGMKRSPREVGASLAGPAATFIREHGGGSG